MNEWARRDRERGRQENGCGRNSSFITPFLSRTCALSRCLHGAAHRTCFHPPAHTHLRFTHFGTIFHHETLSSSYLNWVSIGAVTASEIKDVRKVRILRQNFEVTGSVRPPRPPSARPRSRTTICGHPCPISECADIGDLWEGLGSESSRQPDKIAWTMRIRESRLLCVNRGWNMGCCEKSYYFVDNLCPTCDARRRRRRFIWRVKCVSLTDTQLCGCSDGRESRSRATWPLSFLSENAKGEEASER